MSGSHDADAVSAHYTAGDLDATILAHLRASGLDPDALGVEELAEIDQSHASVHRLVPGSGHFIQRDAPDAVVAAIRELVEATRRS
ncbi:MAG: hypothetical protein LC793_16100 [Thermomicrobia bacterium]|nr:hypothetical protein [Thermomicrobia bacterium]